MNVPEREKRMRYCCLSSCQYFRGTMDPNVRFFRSPINRELRAKWAESLHLDPQVIYRLCSEHFRAEDVSKKRLKAGAIPIPLPRFKISESIETEHIEIDAPVENVENVENFVNEDFVNEDFVDDDFVNEENQSCSVPIENESCLSCSRYEVQLQSANDQISRMEQKMTKMTSEIKMLKKYIGQLESVERPLEEPTKIGGQILYFQCGSCKKAFRNSQRLCRHVRTEHKVKQDSHYYRHIVKDNFECYLCRMEFNEKRKLRLHMRRHERDQKCDICKMSLTLNELNAHLCGNEKTIRCDYCSEEFDVTLKLLEHLETHEKRKFYRCEMCTKFFALTVLKECHMKSHEFDAPKEFICEICSKAYASACLLRSHVKRHEMKNSHLCEECGIGFVSVQNLRLHKSSHIHNDIPRFHCTQCTKKFYSQKCFQRHVQIDHAETSREDKYVCDICQTELSRTTIEQHMKTHRRTDTDRKYACKLCPQKFFDLSVLKNHQAVHNNARLFSCGFCNQSYKYKGDLSKHVKTHIGNKIHKCPTCFKLFEYKDLRKHTLEHYKEEKRAQEAGEHKDE